MTARSLAPGLRYGSATGAGIRRQRCGAGFRYVWRGRPVRDVARLRALAIPPAWTDVWIAPDPRWHLQATGRDARGRKQYRYHPRWRELRDATKYDRLLEFIAAMPRIRRQLRLDLARPGLPREKVLATVVQLMEKTALRVGNEEYARANRSFGLTTLRNHHVTCAGLRLRFSFRGKSGKWRSLTVADARLARIVKRCREIPGCELFQYLADGEPHGIDSADVNEYLRTITGADFTAKDFRTWAGTVLAVAEFHQQPGKPTLRNINRAITRVAEQLGNTVSICRKCYIHPAIIAAYRSGALATHFTKARRRGVRHVNEAVARAILKAS